MPGVGCSGSAGYRRGAMKSVRLWDERVQRRSAKAFALRRSAEALRATRSAERLALLIQAAVLQAHQLVGVCRLEPARTGVVDETGRDAVVAQPDDLRERQVLQAR